MELFRKKPKKQAVRENKEKAEKETKQEEPKKHIGKIKIRAFRILKAPHITEKAAALAEKGKYIFKVYSGANKVEIKKAIEGFYGVKVRKVNIVHMKPKKRRLGRIEGWKGGLKKGFKKAIVTLKEGEKIEVMPR